MIFLFILLKIKVIKFMFIFFICRWAFRYGSAAISGIAAISSGYMLNFFRKKLKMRHVGYLTSMVSGMVAPALGSGLLHTEVTPFFGIQNWFVI